MKAYVLVNTKSGAAEEVAKTIRTLESVISAECVYGRFDVIAIIENPQMETVNRIVHAIQKDPGILHTETALSHYVEDHQSDQGITE